MGQDQFSRPRLRCDLRGLPSRRVIISPGKLRLSLCKGSFMNQDIHSLRQLQGIRRGTSITQDRQLAAGDIRSYISLGI